MLFTKIIKCANSYVRLLIKMPRYSADKRNQVTNGDIVLLNTEIGTNNLGDYVIMSHCREVLNEILPGEKFIEIATHRQASPDDIQAMKKARAVIVCGTNFIAPRMELKSVWRYSEEMITIPNMVLLGCGGGVRQVLSL